MLCDIVSWKIHFQDHDLGPLSQITSIRMIQLPPNTHLECNFDTDKHNKFNSDSGLHFDTKVV